MEGAIATKTPNVEATELYAALGRALNRWGGIEHSMCSLFCRCINEENSWPTVRAFWAVVSFEGKLAMVSEVVRGRFQHKPELVKRWEVLAADLKSRVSLRNKLAHGTVIRMANYRRGVCPPDLFLSPYHWKNHYQKPLTYAQSRNPRHDSRPKDRLYRKNIDAIAKQFAEADKAIQQFWRDVLPIIRREDNFPPEA